ncbi:T-cell acute lymphocytic leukemia protein 1 homolog [Planococcus citri]|uniref:T-cell acute lymphocytic leukemia protein 1 homolog n=1 Tax=Planococcus citri TaxID=170843 RepID=UPI0031F91DDE
MTQHNSCQNGNESDRMIEDDDDYDDSNDQFNHPHQRNAANARERARMRVLSKAFCRLKTTLPWVPPDTKLSKLDTLRLATSYIAHLRAVLKLSENETNHPDIHPMNMNWPFNFNVNWDSNVRPNEQCTTKADWSNQKIYPNSNYDNSYEIQNNRKHAINRHLKMRPKNTVFQYQMENNHALYPKCDQPDYKMYNYYG